MTHSPQTLHEFVTNLLSDDAARSAFAADPTAALAGAGLQDVTAQDVQEVVPLVLEYTPIHGAESLESGLPVSGDPEDAVEQLQAVAEAASAKEFAHPTSLGTLSGSHTASSEGFVAEGTYEGELASGAAEAEGALDGFAGSISGDSEMGSFAGGAWGSADSFGGGGVFDSEFGSGAFGAEGDLHGVSGGFVAESPLGEAMGEFELSTDQAAGEFELAGSEFTVDGSLEGGLEGGVSGSGSSESPLGSYEFEGSGGPSGFEFSGSGDPGLTLDTDTLAKGGQVAAGTVAGYVSTGGDAFANGLNEGADTLSGYLTGDHSAGDALNQGAEHAADVAKQVDDHTPGAPSDLPSELPAAPPVQPPELPSGPPELPSGDLPVDLPPNGLPSEVPSELPDLPVANPMPEVPKPDVGQLPTQDTVHDAVGNSPVGGAVPDEAPVPEPGQLGDDLNLGG